MPAHYEAVFAQKPRARVMMYRDWLVALSPTVADYISLVCRKRYAERDAQVCALYTLAQQLGHERFGAAVEGALEQQTVGAEYIHALAQAVSQPEAASQDSTPPRTLVAPPQHVVERPLADYEQYVANRHGLVRVSGAW